MTVAERMNVILHKDLIYKELEQEGYIKDTDISVYTVKKQTGFGVYGRYYDKSLRNKDLLTYDSFLGCWIVKHWLDKGYDIRPYKNFTLEELYELEQGLDAEVDVSVYASRKYNAHQMREIRLGLEEGLDIRVYAKPCYKATQMNQIRKGLLDGLDVSYYLDPSLSKDNMEQIRLGLEQGLDVSIYANNCFTSGQMKRIRMRLEKGKEVDINAILM